jgi:hypothetical protein
VQGGIFSYVVSMFKPVYVIRETDSETQDCFIYIL